MLYTGKVFVLLLLIFFLVRAFVLLLVVPLALEQLFYFGRYFIFSQRTTGEGVELRTWPPFPPDVCTRPRVHGAVRLRAVAGVSQAV